MCGRFTLRTPPRQIAQHFGLDEVPDLPPRYNIAPSQTVAAVRAAHGRRELAMLQWGLVPAFADDPKIGNRLINARCESVDTKPMFRSVFQRRRCLVVADGFYEWRQERKQKQPYRFTLQDGGVFAFAGLWERWRKPRAREGQGSDAAGDTPIETFTIIVTEANDLVGKIHNRMPVILKQTDEQRWLDPRRRDLKELVDLLAPYPADAMAAYPVSPLVNSVANDVPECIEPAA